MTKWCHWHSSAGDQPCLLESAYALLGSIAFRYSTCLSVWAWPEIIFSNKQGYGLVPQPGLEKHSRQGHNTKLLICGPKLGRSVSCYSPWSDCVNSWLYREAKPLIGSTSRALQKGTQSAWIWTLIGTSPSSLHHNQTSYGQALQIYFYMIPVRWVRSGDSHNAGIAGCPPQLYSHW